MSHTEAPLPFFTPSKYLPTVVESITAIGNNSNFWKPPLISDIDYSMKGLVRCVLCDIGTWLAKMVNLVWRVSKRERWEECERKDNRRELCGFQKSEKRRRRISNRKFKLETLYTDFPNKSRAIQIATLLLPKVENRVSTTTGPKQRSKSTAIQAATLCASMNSNQL
jgi:hypothetical protein